MSETKTNPMKIIEVIKEQLDENKNEVVIQIDLSIEAEKKDGEKNQNEKESCTQLTSDLLLDHLNIYLTPTFIDGKATKSMPLKVFNGFTEPELLVRKETVFDKSTQKEATKKIFYYNEFDEKNGYKSSARMFDTYRNTEYTNHNNMRNVQTTDGMISLYSKNNILDIQVKQKTLQTEAVQMLICITMYSEPKDFLINTLRGIYRNLKGFKRMGISSKQIVVVILQDGIMKMKEEMVNFFSQQDLKSKREFALAKRRQIIQQQIDFLKRNNQQSVLDYNEGLPNTIPKEIALLQQDLLSFEGQEELLPTFSVFKHLNAKKLSSHLWFFEGFCRQFQPKYCALVDVGTIPDQDGLVNMFKALEGNQRIGGVCGFMGLKTPQENRKDLKMEEEIQKMKQEIIKLQKEKHNWILEDEIKQLEKEQMEKQDIRQIQNGFFSTKFTSQKINYNNNSDNSNFLRIKEKKVRINLILIFNVLYLLNEIITYLYSKISLILKKLFFVFAAFLRYFFNFASLPQAQNYEYTTAHMIDKNFESALGFLHVLPGAWSAYRYKALNITKENRENLIQKRYLKQILNKNLLSNTIQELNMFLAEDRILCLGIFCQIQSNFILKFIPDAKAFTDPVDTFEDFLHQRRRWINSSWFALNYVLQNYEYHIQESSHSYIMKNVLFPLNMLFAEIGKLNTYFIPAFYLFVAIICSFQFLKPTTQITFKLIQNQSDYENSEQLKCSLQDNLPSNTGLCSETPVFPCSIQCSTSQISVVFFTFLNFIPAILVVLIIMVIFASLTFKPKAIKITSQEEDEYKHLLENQKYGILTSEEKKRKQVLQNKFSQQFQNNVFKTLASFISLIVKYNLGIIIDFNQLKNIKQSCLVFLIVLCTIFLNVFEIQIGFEQTLSSNFRTYLIVMLIINYGSFAISMLVHLFFQPFIFWNIVKSFISYWIYSPIYNYILLIFSFCNIDDVTWGTKGLTDSKQNEKLKDEKIRFVGKWILCNTFVLTVLLIANTISTNTPYVIMIVGGYGTAYSFIKTLVGTLHYLKYFFFDKAANYMQRRSKQYQYISAFHSIEYIFTEKIKQIQQTIADYRQSTMQNETQQDDNEHQHLDCSDSIDLNVVKDSHYDFDLECIPEENSQQSTKCAFSLVLDKNPSQVMVKEEVDPILEESEKQILNQEKSIEMSQNMLFVTMSDISSQKQENNENNNCDAKIYESDEHQTQALKNQNSTEEIQNQIKQDCENFLEEATSENLIQQIRVL